MSPVRTTERVHTIANGCELRYTFIDPPRRFGAWARSCLRAASAFLRPRRLDPRPAPSPPAAPRATVYVDGFNLYYGALRGTAEKWLDLEHLTGLLFPRYDIQRVKYFTAPVTARPLDPQQPQRQQTYLRALRTGANCEIIEGRFYVTYPKMRLQKPAPGLPDSVRW